MNLPTEAERKRLCALLANVFVHIRTLARESGDTNIEALADAFHNLPNEMHGWGRWDPELTHGMIADYGDTHGMRGLADTFRECLRADERESDS